MSHANNRSFREASASQNASINIPREKIEKRLSCLLHKLKLSNGTKDSWFSNKTIKIIHDAPLMKTKGICSCNQMKQITFTWMLTSDSNHNAIQWKKLHLSDLNDRAFHLSASYLMVARRKVCDERTPFLGLTAEPFTTFRKQTSHANFVRIVTRMCYHTFYKAD